MERHHDLKNNIVSVMILEMILSKGGLDHETIAKNVQREITFIYHFELLYMRTIQIKTSGRYS